MHQERRAAEREFIALRLILEDGTSAVTRDLSPIGLYMLLPAGRVLADRVPFQLELPGGRLTALAEGEVVRIDLGPWMTGVALKLQIISLQPSH